MTAARTRIWPANGHYMGLNLGLFWQIEQYKGMNFGAGQSDSFTGPDAPVNGYSGRISCDGENTGKGAAVRG